MLRENRAASMAWPCLETFAAELFSIIPAFSVAPNLYSIRSTWISCFWWRRLAWQRLLGELRTQDYGDLCGSVPPHSP